MGKVVDFGTDYVDIETKGNRYRLYREKWQSLRYSWDEQTKSIQQIEEGSFSQIPLKLGWAVTIHKSQGSEFDYVILPIFTGYKKLLSRNLLYTAMTRAKKMLIIVGNRNVVNYMVDNLDSKNRKTGLREKIERMLYEDTSKFKS